MKRRTFLALSAIAPLAVRGLRADEINPRTNRLAPKKRATKPITVAQRNELNGSAVQDFSVASLPPAQRQRARELAGAANALLLKGLLNRLDPRTYPVPTDPSSPEARVAALARGLSSRTFTRLRPRLLRASRQPAQLSRALGPLANINFRKTSLSADLARLSLRVRSGATPQGEPRSGGPNYNRLDLILRALHCVDETNPEGGSTDDMVLGGILVGASGNTKTINSVVCGEFNDDSYQNFGEYPLGFYSLNTTSSYPKTFYAISASQLR